MKMLKKLTLASLIFLGAEANAQFSNKYWTPVTEGQFKGFNIPKDSIQTIDLRKTKDRVDTDNSKRGKIFTDRSGATYYWYNPNPTNEKNYAQNGNIFEKGKQLPYNSKNKTNEEIKEEKPLTEKQQLETLINDPEIKNLINNFNSNFQVRWGYYVLGEDIYDSDRKDYRKKGSEVFSKIIDINKDYPYGIILKDKKTSKEVLVIEKGNSMDYDLETFLEKGNHGIRYAINHILWAINLEKKLTTLEEKKNFIRPYFTDSIPNAIKNLPKYNPPIIYKKNVVLKKVKGEQIKYENNIKFENAKPEKSVEMNEQKLDEILKDEEK